MDVNSLSAAQLDDALLGFVTKGREVDVAFLVHLAEVDRRRSYERHGYPSLWQYCLKHLNLGEGQCYRRVNACRILQRFSFAAEYLRDGRLCMTKLAFFKDVVTEENVRRLLDSAVGKTQEEVERIAAAEKAPKPLPPSSIRKRPEAPQPLSFGVVTAESATEATPPAEPPSPPPVGPLMSTPPRAEIKVFGGEAFIIKLSARAELVEKLKRARSILSHAIPSGDFAAVVERIVDEFLAKEEQRHGVAGRKSRKKRPSKDISAETERELWIRDGGRCAWPMPGGAVCGSTWQLEPNHIVALAMGGTNDLANLMLTCRAHNQRHARETFGAELIAKKIAG